MKFELFRNGELVGIEEHKVSSYYNKKQVRIFHGKINGNSGMWDIKEWPERYIEHDKKECLHDNMVVAGGISVCYDCGYDDW
jgi:hypothetical protein